MDDSLKMIAPNFDNMRRSGVLRDHVEDRAEQKCAQRKLNSICLVVWYCAVVNSAENMQRMQEELQFTAACAEINRRKEAIKRRSKERRP